ncbi:MAG: hypothetical protein AAFQ42_10925 [Pseudomonadota bacterium]
MSVTDVATTLGDAPQAQSSSRARDAEESPPSAAATGPADLAALDRAILDAHAREAHQDLAHLYQQAGEHAAFRGDVEASGFLFTHAYIFALKAGLRAQAELLHARLAATGREA